MCGLEQHYSVKGHKLKKVITTQLAAFRKDLIQDYLVLDPSDIDRVIEKVFIEASDEIHILDRTYSEDHENDKEFIVNDHVNRTGSNPLIGRQNQLGVDFTDLTDLYVSDPNGVITNCVGENMNAPLISYPSAFLCNVSIIARAAGCRKINAILINCKKEL